MTSLESPIKGVVITTLREISDERGAVLHMLRCDEPGFTRFGECYFSEILPGVIKAWKRHREQTQVLAVPVGRIRMVIFDNRQASTTKGQVQELELGRTDAYLRVSIPPGLWYGFTCLNDQAALVANCVDLPHDPADTELRPEDDSRIPYRW